MIFETYDSQSTWKAANRNASMKPSEKRFQGRIALFAMCIVMAVVGLGGSIYHAVRAHSMTATAEATVSDYKEVKKKGAYSVTVTFEDSDHVSHEADSVGYWTSKPRNGDTVQIKYDPWRPEGGFVLAAEDNATQGHHRLYIVLLIVGTVGSVVTYKLFIQERDKEDQEEMVLLSDNPDDFVSDGMSYGVSVNDGSDASSDNWEDSHRMSL